MTKRKAKPKPKAKPQAKPQDELAVTVGLTTKAKLEAAAKKNRLSVSEEIARRLEIMFAHEEFATYTFGDDDTRRFILRIAGAVVRAEQRLGRRWYSDHSAIIQTKAAVMQEMTGHVLIEQLGFERPNA